MFWEIGKIVVFGVLLTVFFCEPTDADLLVTKTVASNIWEATTLDFSSKDTANNRKTGSLFLIDGLLPGGFQVRTFRIKNEGKIKFSYLLTAEKTTGDDMLLDALQIKVMKDWVTLYEGPVRDFLIEIRDPVTEKDDWVVMIGMKTNEGVLMEKELTFNLIIKSEGEKGKGFYCDQVLENRVVSGRW